MDEDLRQLKASVWYVDDATYEWLLAELAKPPTPNPKLQALFARPSPFKETADE